MTFVSIYNFLASVLRSIGNTVVPLLFLAAAAVTNIVLDLVFILALDLGVAGAALATVIAQAVSGALSAGGVALLGMEQKGADLEAYFLNLIGGGRNG